MNGGFSFCGVDIADLGIEYAPEIENTYVYKPAKSNIHEETFDGHNGGYIYGAWKEPKEFVLRCYYDEKRIDRGMMANIYALFKLGRSGKLVFQRRPWIYYYATVMDVDDSEGMTYLSGLITITMKSAYPYGRSEGFVNPESVNKTAYNNMFVNKETDDNHFEVMLNTAFFDKPLMTPPFSFNSVSSARTIILPNPGTEQAPLSIKIAGTAGLGIEITNLTNGSFCNLVAFNNTITNNARRYVYVDAISGKTMLKGNDFAQLASLYHDQGFITLEPAFPALREIYASYNETTVTTTNILYEDCVGKYIFLKSKWRKIVAQPDSHTLTLDSADTVQEGMERTTIMAMNEIEIKPVSSMYINNIEFVYKPTFA